VIGKNAAKRTTFRSRSGFAVMLIAGFLGPLTVVTAAMPARAADGLRGFALAKFNGNPNMHRARAKGATFVYIEATEGLRTNPHFNAAHAGAIAAGLFYGSYEVARPKGSSGTAQAQYFLSHGGSWNDSGMVLPGAVELDANPTGSSCYDLSQDAMVSWILDFSDFYHSNTGRYPVIATTAGWWHKCTGNSDAFAQTSPLLIFRWAASPGTLPGGWSDYTFWDDADAGPLPGEQVLFNGDAAALATFATAQ
jgi:GH25 family lysozyme M1 (1,4-beta-N-acetylmuramidase)